MPYCYRVCKVYNRLSNGRIAADELVEASDSELIEVLIDQTREARAVIVFDNVDSYVDLENRSFTGMIDSLVQKFSTSDSSSRIILTCRPDVQYASSSIITFPMKGISAKEASELFSRRAPNVHIEEADIIEAHSLTNGHAFWLDLLAVQLSNVPGSALRKMLDDMRRGREGGPDVLSSIWDTLPGRERTLLRLMAEAVRPETEQQIARFASSQLTQKNFQRALKSLKSLNLIVVKPEVDAPDLYDLHPLVRQFVKTTFSKRLTEKEVG